MLRYESYKPSVTEWLGNIPSHWTEKKSKFLWREKEDRSLLGNEELLSVSQYSGIVPRAEDSRSESLEDYKKCQPDDLVINIMLAWMGGLGVSNHVGIVSPAYCVYRQLEKHNPQYLGYLYRTPLYLAEFARRSKGIVPSRWRMYTEDFGRVLAFSGDKTVDGIKYTEEGLNGIAARKLPETFEQDDYKILVVANKYLTGFDEPMLHTMYVDKKLQGVLAVQALSRLNRCNWKLDKRDTFVLDFYNAVDDIKAAFDPFYTATTLSEPTDVNVLHDLKDELDKPGYYEWAEVLAFNEAFFGSGDHEELTRLIDNDTVKRFDGKPEELGHLTPEALEAREAEKIDFKIKAKQFVKIYAQVASIIPFDNANWEMLHWFLKFLIPKLKVKDPEQDKLDELLNSVDLSTYGLERSKLNAAIGLDATETELDPQNARLRGYFPGGGDKDPLEAIIQAFNERHFAGWQATPEEQRVKFINIARHVVGHADYKAQIENNPDIQNRQLALEKLIQGAIGTERKRELELYKRYASDPDFKRAFDASIARLLASRDFGSRLF